MRLPQPRWTPPPASQRLADLAQHLEELFGSIWALEKEWDLDDRIAAAIRYGASPALFRSDGRRRH